MDIRRAALDRIHHYLVDEFDDGRVVDVDPRIVLGFVLGTDLQPLQVFEVVVVTGQVRHAGIGRFQAAVDSAGELVLLDEDGLDVAPGGELYFV